MLMETKHLSGLIIDSVKFFISAIILAYAWYVLASITKLKPLTIEELVLVQQEQIAYSYYITLGIIAMLAYIVDYFYYKIQFTPAYSRPFNRKHLTFALLFSMLFIVGGLVGLYTTGIKPITAVIYSIPLAIAHGLKGIIENMFFIGLIGFGIWTLLSKGSRTLSTAIISAIIVGIISVAWHLYKLFHIYAITGMQISTVIPVAISIFIFFFIGAIISFLEDKTWTWDIVHFMVNFSIGLLGAKGYLIL